MTGVDLSEWQAKEYSTADFYFVRLGYGVTEDGRAEQHVAFAKQNNIPVGGYWAMYEPHGADGAKACYAVMQKLGIYRIACDAEQFPGAAPLQVSTVKDFVSTMKSLNGDCGVYSGYWAKNNGGITFGADWGWLADYTAFDLPSGWTKDFTLFWQYTSSQGTLDQDKWMSSGDIAAWFSKGEDMSQELDDMVAGKKAAKAGDPLPKNASKAFIYGYTTETQIIAAAKTPVPPAPSAGIAPHTHDVGKTGGVSA